MYEEALRDFAKVLEYNPKDAGVVYNNRGFLFNKMGRFEEAMKENGKAIEVLYFSCPSQLESWIQMMILHTTIEVLHSIHLEDMKKHYQTTAKLLS